MTPVTVIVPVYRGVDDVRRCLESVVRHTSSNQVPVEVIAIDDASPEPEVPAYLESLASDDLSIPITVFHNAGNGRLVKMAVVLMKMARRTARSSSWRTRRGTWPKPIEAQ